MKALLLILLLLYAVIIIWCISINAAGGILIFAVSAAAIGAYALLFWYIKKQWDKSNKFNNRK